MPSPHPEAALLRRWTLPVDGVHELLVQEFGAADGLPALVLHGGPGSGQSPVLRQGFDAARYRIICPDQRGAGGSRPRGGTTQNTTADLVADLGLLRERLGLASWLVVGGSWGATLALAYAAAEPQAVRALLLRSSFAARPQDITGFFQDAARAPAPTWERLAASFDAAERGALLEALHRRLLHGSAPEQQAAAQAWWAWEQAVAGGATNPAPLAGEALARQVDRLRVQAHYLRHGCWLDSPSLAALCERVPAVPTLLIHAEDDRICPPDGARALAARLPHARLQWLPAGGHDPTHPALRAATQAALDRYAAGGDFGAGA